MTLNNQNDYLAPEFEVLDIEVEQGFAASSNIEDPDENPEQEW